MADQTRNMLVKITGDSTEFKRAMSDVTGSNDKVQSSFKNLAGGVAVGMAGFEVFSTALHKVSGFFTEAGHAADDQDLALARLSNGIMNVKSATDKHIGSLIEQSKELEKTTRFSDEQVLSGQGMLSTFQLNQKAILALTPRLADMSEGLAHVTGEMPDLEQNAILVGKAIGGEDTAGLVGALRRVGVVMTDAQKNTLTYGDMQQRLGIITQVLDQNFKGMAVSAGDTAAGGMAKLHNQINNVQEAIGNAQHAISMGFIGSLTQLVGGNTEMVASLAVAGAAMLAFGAAILVVTKVMNIFAIQSFIDMLTNPLTAALLAVGALLGYFAYNVMSKFQEKMKSASGATSQLSNGLMNEVPKGASAASKAISDLQEQLAKIDDQIDKSNRDFREQLASMVKTSQDKVKSLGDQLQQEKEDFEQSEADKDQSFQSSQQSQLDAHQNKVDQLQKQINKQLSMGKSADQQELAALQQELDKENTAYAKASEQAQMKYDQDVKNAQEAHDKKTADLQAQLAAENTLLTQHAADVANVRQSDFVDEIDKLHRSHNEQLKAFTQQKADLIKNAKDTTAGITGAFGSMPGDIFNASAPGMGQVGSGLGNAMGNAMKQAIKESFIDAGKGIANFAGAAVTFLVKGFDPRKTNDPGGLSSLWKEAQNDPAFGFRASGGPVRAGEAYTVGETGREIYVPNQDGTIIPADKTASMLQPRQDGATNITQHNNTFQMSIDVGMYAGMPAEKREMAGQIWKEIVRIAKAQGVVLPQIGMPIQ